MTTPIGHLLHSDQPADEIALLAKISEAHKLLGGLTFESPDGTLANQRTRDTACQLADALWRLIYFANGS
jgi:hypothetical protein